MNSSDGPRVPGRDRRVVGAGVDLEERGRALDDRAEAGLPEARRDAIPKALAEPVEAAIRGRVEQPQRRQPGRGRDGVAVERTAMAEGSLAPRVEQPHHVGSTAEPGEREAAADDLAERRQVGADAGDALAAARSHPERDRSRRTGAGRRSGRTGRAGSRGTRTWRRGSRRRPGPARWRWPRSRSRVPRWPPAPGPDRPTAGRGRGPTSPAGRPACAAWPCRGCRGRPARTGR